MAQLVFLQPGHPAKEEADIGDHLLDIAVGGHNHHNGRVGGRRGHREAFGGG